MLCTLILITACFPLARAITAGRERWTAHESLVKSYQDEPKLRQQWEEYMKKFTKESEEDMTRLFECNTAKSNELPTSVHKLRPGDIKIVGALGDSITAGFGVRANNIFEVLIQDRGYVFSVGGVKTYDEGVVTLPNILKKYNEDIYGYSTGAGSVDKEVARFNVAVGGSMASDLPGQADMIIQRMKDEAKINMEEDWKMVTIFIGGNDLCGVCFDEKGLGSAAFIKNMETTLDKLAEGLPRAIVNVIPIIDITPLPRMSSNLLCAALQTILCPCAFSTQYHELLKKTQAEYSSYTANLTTNSKYNTDEFTVVFQPFLRDTKPPTDANGEYDLSYFSPDCFHFSEKGHRAVTRQLWNSLFEPVGRKPTSMNFKEIIECPAVGDYIKTNRNSNSNLAKVKASDTDRSSHFVNAAVAQPELASPSHHDGRTPTTGVIIVGSICGILLVVVVLMIVVIRRRVPSEESAPLLVS